QATLSVVKPLATVKKLLTPTPAPIEIATRLEDHRLAGRRGRLAVARRPSDQLQNSLGRYCPSLARGQAQTVSGLSGPSEASAGQATHPAAAFWLGKSRRPPARAVLSRDRENPLGQSAGLGPGPSAW